MLVCRLASEGRDAIESYCVEDNVYFPISKSGRLPKNVTRIGYKAWLRVTGIELPKYGSTEVAVTRKELAGKINQDL